MTHFVFVIGGLFIGNKRFSKQPVLASVLIWKQQMSGPAIWLSIE
jgi:hypothetical protein